MSDPIKLIADINEPYCDTYSEFLARYKGYLMKMKKEPLQQFRNINNTVTIINYTSMTHSIICLLSLMLNNYNHISSLPYDKYTKTISLLYNAINRYHKQSNYIGIFKYKIKTRRVSDNQHLCAQYYMKYSDLSVEAVNKFNLDHSCLKYMS